jgi:hypothetical protein
LSKTNNHDVACRDSAATTASPVAIRSPLGLDVQIRGEGRQIARDQFGPLCFDPSNQAVVVDVTVGELGRDLGLADATQSVQRLP